MYLSFQQTRTIVHVHVQTIYLKKYIFYYKNDFFTHYPHISRQNENLIFTTEMYKCLYNLFLIAVMN